MVLFDCKNGLLANPASTLYCTVGYGSSLCLLVLDDLSSKSVLSCPHPLYPKYPNQTPNSPPGSRVPTLLLVRTSSILSVVLIRLQSLSPLFLFFKKSFFPLYVLPRNLIEELCCEEWFSISTYFWLPHFAQLRSHLFRFLHHSFKSQLQLHTKIHIQQHQPILR